MGGKSVVVIEETAEEAIERVIGIETGEGGSIGEQGVTTGGDSSIGEEQETGKRSHPGLSCKVSSFSFTFSRSSWRPITLPSALDSCVINKFPDKFLYKNPPCFAVGSHHSSPLLVYSFFGVPLVLAVA